MRTLKFKGKTTNDKRWVCGFLSRLPGNRYYFITCEDGNLLVNPDTVGQYTERKDKHGTEIYEGDIVKTNRNVGVVRYNAKQWFYEVASIDESLDEERKPGGIPEEDWEVLGNIHDNPELLKQTGYYE